MNKQAGAEEVGKNSRGWLLEPLLSIGPSSGEEFSPFSPLANGAVSRDGRRTVFSFFFFFAVKVSSTTERRQIDARARGGDSERNNLESNTRTLPEHVWHAKASETTRSSLLRAADADRRSCAG